MSLLFLQDYRNPRSSSPSVGCFFAPRAKKQPTEEGKYHAAAGAYLPGWRGGRRESGALRTTGCLNPPAFAPDFGDLPPA
jgi:hypothetical protein